jgi:hypothetical protein
MNHWRAMMDSPYLGSWDIPDGKDIIVTIKAVRQGEVTNAQKKTSKKPLIFFEGQEKGLVANVTNCKAIARLYGDDPRDWIGKRVTIGVSETSVGGETMPCIRVRPKAPPPPKVDVAKERVPGQEG